jgi:hypothetical protein
MKSKINGDIPYEKTVKRPWNRKGAMNTRPNLENSHP